MKKHIFLWIIGIICLFTTPGFASEKFSLTFKTQSKIDAFPAMFPNLEIIEGSIKISGEDITDLSPLSSLKVIGGDLRITNCPYLESLYGLHAVDSVYGSFGVGYCVRLKTIKHLKIKFVGVNIRIGCAFLENLEGLEHIKSCQWMDIARSGILNCKGLDSLEHTAMFRIYYCDRIKNIEGLNSLKTADQFNVKYCPSIKSVHCPASLKRVNGSVVFYTNDSLKSITGFNGLEHIQGSLYFSRCYQLNIINGFNDLKTINERIHLSYNTDLDFITGFQSLERIKESFEIEGSPNLFQISGFNNLKAIGEDFILDKTRNLYSLGHFEKLDTIYGKFYMIENTNITEIELFNNIDYIEEVIISGCQKIQNIDFLYGLNKCESLGILNCRSLKNLTGLENLKQVNNLLRIFNCDSINNIQALRNLETKHLKQIHIAGNKNLSNCVVYAICEFLKINEKETLIQSNGTDCKDNEEAKALCTTLAIPETEVDQMARIYPNPATDKIFVSLNDKTEGIFRLFSINGALLKEESTHARNYILLDISDLKAGLYIGELSAANRTTRTKIVKK